MTALELLIKQLDERVAFIQEGVSLGRAASFEEYKGTCGEIKGLLTARGFVLDLKQKMEDSDD
jgi:hypothetical protein